MLKEIGSKIKNRSKLGSFDLMKKEEYFDEGEIKFILSVKENIKDGLKLIEMFESFGSYEEWPYFYNVVSELSELFGVECIFSAPETKGESNNIVYFGDYVYKFNDKNEFFLRRFDLESKVMAELERETKKTYFGIIYKKLRGVTLSQDDVNPQTIKNISEKIKELRLISSDFISINNLEVEYKNRKEMIIASSEKYEINVDVESILSDAVNLYTNSRKVVSHEDINLGNVLIHEGKVELIDFERVSINTELYDPASMIVHIGDEEIIEEIIANFPDISKNSLLIFSISIALDSLWWCDKKLEETGEEKFKVAINKYKDKICLIKKMLQ